MLGLMHEAGLKLGQLLEADLNLVVKLATWV
jgi:hypothetical protein